MLPPELNGPTQSCTESMAVARVSVNWAATNWKLPAQLGCGEQVPLDPAMMSTAPIELAPPWPVLTGRAPVVAQSKLNVADPLSPTLFRTWTVCAPKPDVGPAKEVMKLP